MSTLNTIRQKLRDIRTPTPAAMTPGGTGAMMPTTQSSSMTPYLIGGLILGAIVLLVVCKMWMGAKEDAPAGKPLVGNGPSAYPPADQYAAQLAERIRASQPVRPVAPVVLRQPVSAPQRQEDIGRWPQPEPGPGSAMEGDDPGDMMPEDPVFPVDAPGGGGDDPYLTPL